MDKKTLRNITVLIVIGIVVVAGVLINKTRQSPLPSKPKTTIPLLQQKTQKEMDLPDKKKGTIEIINKTATPREEETVTLARVNERPITSKELDEELESLPPQYQDIFEENKEELLEQLIIKEILFQEAERQKLEDEKEIQEKIEANKKNRKEILVQELIQKMIKDVQVSPEEIRTLYEKLEGDLQGESFQEIENQLKTYLLQEKGRKKLEIRIEELKTTAKIARNEEWVKAQLAIKMKNPLDAALQKGRPVVADFGQDTCIPCKQMKPILEELAIEYKEKASILIIEIDEYKTLTRRHRVRLIPTQIFFDDKGNEVYRNEGFMGKEAIKEKLNAMGVK